MFVIGQWLAATSKLLSRKGLADFLEDELERLMPDMCVLSIGSGGPIEELVRKVAKGSGFKVVFSDIDPERNPDVVDDVTRSSFPDHSFDAVVVMEVLEHVINPLSAASEISRILKPGGRLIASTPFMFPLHDRPHDYFRYTRYGLACLFKGFEGLNIQERNSWAEALLVLLARLSNEKSPMIRYASPFFVIFALICTPAAIVVGLLFPSDFFTTGYVVSGSKARASAVTSG